MEPVVEPVRRLVYRAELKDKAGEPADLIPLLASIKPVDPLLALSVYQWHSTLFLYAESTQVQGDLSSLVELLEPQYDGRLNTKNTPPNWGEFMDPHFAPWPDDGPRLWRQCQELFAWYRV
jgi:hypothetical protein